MKYYKLLDGSIRAIGDSLDVEGDQSFLVEPSWVLMTQAEFQEYFNPGLTAEEIDAQKKAELQAYWDSLEITINGKTFLGNQNNCTLMELKKATLMDAEQTTFPAKYGFVDTDKIELQQILNQVSTLLDAKKLEIWGA